MAWVHENQTMIKIQEIISAMGCALVWPCAVSLGSVVVTGLARAQDGTMSAATLGSVTVVGSNDMDERRQSTAAKIIIGREEIERYGDSTMGELLKRLPGITSQGRPGRGGAPRMRGMGSGYTQILIDGERAPRGFSLDDLDPEQVERIEILRAPTAETGARAIAGTINVITRGGFKKYINNLTIATSFERSNVAPMVSWTRNDSADNLSYNYSLSASHSQRANDSRSLSTTENLTTGEVVEQVNTTISDATRSGMSASGRLQWRLDGGDLLMLSPLLVFAQTSNTSASQYDNSANQAPHTRSTSTGMNRNYTLRLTGLWIHKLEGDANLRVSTGLGKSQWDNVSLRQSLGGTQGDSPLADQRSQQNDTNINLNTKYTKTLVQEHSLVAGMELESNARKEVATTLQNGDSPLTEFDGDLEASTRRIAVYAQDEWSITPNWAAHAGLRWEGIRVHGAVASSGFAVNNDNAVTTPLLHAVWRPSLPSKDQVRLSLTRSYRSPNLQDFIAQPTLNILYLNRGPNIEKYPDRAGNPNLQPELASGLDVAFEHYLNGGGIASANVFYRKVQGLIRARTELESVSWADVPRWVSRRRNIGDASTYGIEFDTKFRLQDVLDGAPQLDMRANLALMRSSVEGIPAPDNRLDQQPDASLNLGADYSVPASPLKIGGNLNFTPAYTTRLDADQTTYAADRLVVDAFAVWAFSAANKLRISFSNAVARNYLTSNTRISSNELGQTLRDTTGSNAPTYVNVQIRWELKL